MVRMTPKKLDFVRHTITRHIRLHFHKDAVDSYQAASIVWIEWDELYHNQWLANSSIIIPIVPRGIVEPATWSVPFRDTTLVLWNRLPLPKGWQCDDAKSPLWYKCPRGHLMPAWDILGTMIDLLTMEEERAFGLRDKMGRSVASMSPRQEDGRLQVPFVNNSAAALVDLCLRQKHAKDADSMPFAKPVTVCLSHDLDQLRGDDFWTQAARLWQFVSPLCRFELPHFPALAGIVYNVLHPRQHFMDDLLAMVAVEQTHGFKSINYVLCGTSGRYGARTPSRFIGRYLQEVELYCDTGIHYNLDTNGRADAFFSQKKEIEALTSCVAVAGRAHYLLMDPQVSFKFWQSQGIEIDESLGYPDAVGYRAGIAGPFQPFDTNTQSGLSITSLPLVAMDSAIALQYGADYESAIEDLISHLSVVGGTFSLLFHPGMFANPEHPETLGMYGRILEIFATYNAVSKTPLAILKEVNSIDADLH